MKVLYDTNVLLDVFQFRVPHYAASAKSLSVAIEEQITGYFPAHAVATVDYVLKKHSDRKTAEEAVGWLLDVFQIVSCDGDTLRGALAMELPDFEDAIVIQCALSASCDCIVTRNTSDFMNSPLTVVTPDELLQRLQAK
jgi:predicted nucleic acid-binding protein